MKRLRWLRYGASLAGIWPTLSCHMYLQTAPSSSQQVKVAHLEPRSCAKPRLPGGTDALSEALLVLRLSFAHLSGRIAVKTHVRRHRVSARWDGVAWCKPPRRHRCKTAYTGFVWSSCCFSVGTKQRCVLLQSFRREAQKDGDGAGGTWCQL